MLRTPIRIPAAFLNALHTRVNGVDGTPLSINYCQTQHLNSCNVMIQADGGSAMITSFAATVLVGGALMVWLL